MAKKTIVCPCGWTVTTDNDDDLVAKVQQHAREVHSQSPSREEVLALAKPACAGDAGRVSLPASAGAACHATAGEAFMLPAGFAFVKVEAAKQRQGRVYERLPVRTRER
jgi:predicted small metal-binding protein